jgi:hypothetical protein
MRWFVDRPADRLLTDRVELLCGWVDAPVGAFELRARCAGRELTIRPCPHPHSRREAPVQGFWAFLFVQELLPEVDASDTLSIDLLWGGQYLTTLKLRLLPMARELAERFPLHRDRYPVPPRAGATLGTALPAADDEPPVVVFPGLGGVGGASLNQLVRCELFARGWTLPAYSEADSPEAWARLCASSPPRFRWIDGHDCFAAARMLGARFARITLLRDPLRRLASVVNYGSIVHPREFPQTDLGELAASGEARRLSMAAGLLRCAHLPYDRAMPDRELYSIASEELDREYALVGITERFEETIFLLCGLIGIDTVGLWWRVLAAPRSPDPSRLPARTRSALERALDVDLRLYDAAARKLEERLARADFGPALARYRRDAEAQPELPELFKAIECLRWRQILGESELGGLLGKPPGFAGRGAEATGA